MCRQASKRASRVIRGVSAGVGTAALLLLSGAACATAASPDARVIRVGSKSFTESFILGELIAAIVEGAGEAEVERKMGLGAAAIAFRAISTGEIDIYPEYTGTLSYALLKDSSAIGVVELRRRLRRLGLTVSDPLGFENTYALAVREDVGERLGLRTITDLKHHPEMEAAFSAGYIDRVDGWPGLQQRYDLRFAEVRVIEHSLSYEAVSRGDVDVIDIYSTDGKIDRFDLRVLVDDLEFFAKYEAVMLVREDFIDRYPRTWERLNELLVGRFDDAEMSALNALADLEGQAPREVAAAFLSNGQPATRGGVSIRDEILGLTLDHAFLVVFALSLATLVSIPLGIVAARFRRLGQTTLVSVGILQTIPSLALLCFMIPLFGIGRLPSLVALFLYALLPIVRSTYTGLIGLDRQLMEIAGVLGLSQWQRLTRIELPLASLNIMAGIKTSAVLTVGTATLAAFIGGGGYGTLIVRGLALNDIPTILAGAVPAAVMALVIHACFELADRFVIPAGLRRSYG